MGSTQVIISFLLTILIFPVVGVIASKRLTGTKQDYLLGGRSSGKILVGLSAGATANSGFLMIASVGLGYTMGISAIVFPLSWFTGELIFWTFFPERVNKIARDANCNTVPELINSRTNNKNTHVIRLFAAFVTIIFIGIYAAAQLLAAGKTVGAVFEMDLAWGILFSAVVITSYCAKGGLRASMWNNVIQALIMMAASYGMLIAAIVIGSGPEKIIQDLSLIDPNLVSFPGGFPTTLILVASAIGFAGAAFGFDLSAPQFMVRLFSGRTPEEVKKAKWIYLGFIQTTWLSMVIFGVILRALIPDIEDPEQGLPTFAMQYLNPLLVGFVMAGIFSAIVSTLDAQLLVVSSAFTVDVSPKLYDKLLTKIGSKIHIIITIIVALALVLIAINVESTVFTLVVFSGSALTGAFAPIVLVIVMKWDTNLRAVKACMSVGLITALVWRISGMSDVMIEALPGMIAGLMAHLAVMKYYGNEKQ